MSDDDAFIAAIGANPFDDTVRLVYADWLEEQGHTDQADYLRVVHALTTLPDQAAGRRKLVKRLLAISAAIDAEWRDAVARRFDVILEGLLGGALAYGLKVVRRLLSGLRIAEFGPLEDKHSVALRSGVRREEAEAALNELDPQRFRKNRKAGMDYRIVPATAAPPALPDAT